MGNRQRGCCTSPFLSILCGCLERGACLAPPTPFLSEPDDHRDAAGIALGYPKSTRPGGVTLACYCRDSGHVSSEALVPRIMRWALCYSCDARAWSLLTRLSRTPVLIP
eukprot:6162564-Pyramimonas_sp.AAC.1